MKKLLLVCACTLLGVAMLLAQRTIRGTITDQAGEPLIGASVLAKGTTIGTVTDIDGTYSLALPEGASILVVSYTGFTSQEVTIGASDVIDISLQQGITLEEAVVTALGIQRSEKSVPYSVQTVDSEKLNTIRQTNLNNALAGKVAGVQIRSQASMALGRDASVRIRGAGSLNDKNPLYVVDGTPTSSADINLDDVENISVLKGPSATALYGQRGDAGVIIITTKKGSKRQGLGIEVNQSTFVDKVYVLPKYQNAYAGGGAADLIRFTWEPGLPEEWKVLDGKYYHDYSDDASWGPRIVGQEYIPWYAWYPDSPYFGKTEPLTAHPDNIRDFYETGVTNNTNVNLSQAGTGYNVRVSLTKQGVEGLLPNSNLNRHVVATQASFDLGKYFTVGANINYVTQRVRGEFVDGYANQSSGSFNQWFHRHVDMERMRELKDLKSPQGYAASWNHNNPGQYFTSPLKFYGGNYWYNFFTYFDNVENINNRERLFGDVNLTFKLNDKFRVAGFLRRNQRNENFENKTYYLLESSATQTGTRNYYGTGQVLDREDNYEVLATYSDRFGLLSVEMNAGGNIRRDSYRSTGGQSADGLTVPDLFTLANSRKQPFSPFNDGTFNNLVDYRRNKQVNSLYARGSFGFNEMLYLEASVRNDWSSALPKNANSYLYPSFGLSFVFSELIGNSLPFLSYGKVRGSWAQVGSDLDPYRLTLNYSLGTDQWNGNSTMATPNTLVDPNIKPALSAAYEGGVDLRFFQNRVGLAFTYFDETKTDEILNVQVAGASGFTNKLINAGKIERNGIELAIDVTPVSTNDLNWTMGINFARNNSKIVELAEGVDAIVQQTGTFGTSFGIQLVHAVGEQWGQLRGGAIKRINGQPVLDASGFFVAEPNSYLGGVLPDFTGGFFNSLTYKNFVFNFNLDFSKGGEYYSLSNAWGKYSGLVAETAGVNDKGNPVRDPVADGGGVRVVGVDEEGKPVDTYVEAFDYFHQFVNHNIAENSVFDLSFIKLREVSIGYTIPVQKTNLGKWLQTATISVVARNPWLIYAANRDFDPSEMGQSYGENGQFPGSRSLGFNLKLGF
ncbi:MAG: SusC/RagA family TonB-linked outer membrane protein [Saprospiraceae bacterium]